MTETPDNTAPRPTAAEKRAAAQAAAAARASSETAPPSSETAPPAATPSGTTPSDTAAPTTAAPTAETPAAAATTAAETTTPIAPLAAEPTAKAEAPAKAENTSRRPVGVIAAITVAALVGGVSGAGVTLWSISANQQAPSSQTSSPTTITVNDPDNATNATAVAVKAAASVVTISVSDGESGGSGSGVILDNDGYILTNTHVVTLDGATSSPDVQVTTNDGRLFDAEIIGTDPIADLAVIKIDADNLTPVEFADSDELNVGDSAIAIGAPLGLAGTVTDGIISSLNRSITIASSAAPDTGEGDSEEAPDQSNPESPFDFWQFDVPGQEQQTPSSSSSTISLAVIQTDAAINPGNSGGALLDSEGRLIGINVAIATAGSSGGASGSIGVGFAIPSNLAKRVADEIIKDGSATHGLLGASIIDVTQDEDSSDSATVGAVIKELVKGGAAAEAGLEVGDVITVVDGVRITGSSDLTAQIRANAAGSDVEITYVRDGKTAQVSVTLGTLEV